MRQPTILVYHWFRPHGAASASLAPQFEIAPSLFERQVGSLARRGYQGVSLSAALDPELASPERPIAITFDDGTADFWDFGRPILARHGFAATLFVVTGRVGDHNAWDRERGEPRRELLDWDQLRALQAEGFEIGSHTHSHPDLTGLSDDDVESELVASLKSLESELGQAPRQLAYPFGAFRAEHRRIAREVGFAGASATILEWTDLRGADRFALRRMPIKGTESMLRFHLRRKLAGAVPLREDPQ